MVELERTSFFSTTTTTTTTHSTTTYKIYHTVQDSRCRLCKQHSETVGHITSGCSKLVETEYTVKHNNAASIVYRTICARYNLEHSKDW